MNTFRHLKTADLDPDAVFVLNYTPPSICRLKSIHLSAKNSAEFDIYFGNNSNLNLIYTVWLGSGTTAYTIHFTPSMMVSNNSAIRIVMWNRHTSAQGLAVTIGLAA